MNIYGIKREDLEKYFLDMGEKKFKALQVFEWLYTHKVGSFFEMTNIKKELQEDKNITEEELQAKYQASRDWEDANRHYREFMKDVKEMEERKWEEYRKKFGQFNNY